MNLLFIFPYVFVNFFYYSIWNIYMPELNLILYDKIIFIIVFFLVIFILILIFFLFCFFKSVFLFFLHIKLIIFIYTSSHIVTNWIYHLFFCAIQRFILNVSFFIFHRNYCGKLNLLTGLKSITSLSIYKKYFFFILLLTFLSIIISFLLLF